MGRVHDKRVARGIRSFLAEMTLTFSRRRSSSIARHPQMRVIPVGEAYVPGPFEKALIDAVTALKCPNDMHPWAVAQKVYPDIGYEEGCRVVKGAYQGLAARLGVQTDTPDRLLRLRRAIMEPAGTYTEPDPEQRWVAGYVGVYHYGE